MRRSVALLLGVAGGMLGSTVFVRRRGALRERIDLYYEDGSMVSVANGSPDAERLIPLAREILHASRH
jgi:hypothetical protein